MADKHCEHCGAPMVEYRHSLSKGLARCLYRIAVAGGGPVNVYQELKFTHSQMCNFRKMQYWGLVEHSSPDNTRDGRWNLTQLGWHFVKGELPVRKWVVTYRGTVTAFEGDLVFISELTDGWRYREDYVADARSVGANL